MVKSGVLMLWDMKYAKQEQNKTMEKLADDILKRCDTVLDLYPGWQIYARKGRKNREAQSVWRKLENFKHNHFYKNGRAFPAMYYAVFMGGVIADCAVVDKEQKKNECREARGKALDNLLTGIRALVRYFEGRKNDDEISTAAMEAVVAWSVLWGVD
jgi:hypothetical protein